MNKLAGTIESVVDHGDLSLVSVRVGERLLSVILIDSKEPYIAQSRSINVLFKETEVVIARGDTTGISMQNQLPCHILSVQKDKLLSRVTLKMDEYEIVSIITTRAVEKLALQVGQEVTALVKTNEVMLSN